MPNVVIQNPILNSPFREPTRHFHFDEQGITDTVIEGRRESEYFMPVPASRKKKGAGQLAFETEWTQDRIENNVLNNQIRLRAKRLRSIWHPRRSAESPSITYAFRSNDNDEQVRKQGSR